MEGLDKLIGLEKSAPDCPTYRGQRQLGNDKKRLESDSTRSFCRRPLRANDQVSSGQ